VIAVPGPHGDITVYGSMQCPYYVHRALKVLLGLAGREGRVIQTDRWRVRRQEEYPSMIAATRRSSR